MASIYFLEPSSENQFIQKKQMATNSKIPKIICRIFATVSILAIMFVLLPEFWFWVSFESIALLLVAIGCGGEWYLHHNPAGRKEAEKKDHHKLESRLIGAVAIGVTMELFSLGHSIREGVILERDVSDATSRLTIAENNGLVLKTNLATLEKATIELAHLYDMSTNALAEAKARLATIKPQKELLIDFLNSFNPTIIPRLKNGSFSIVEKVDASPLSRLEEFSKNPETSKYISVRRTGKSFVYESSMGYVAEIRFNDSLVK